MCSLYVILKAKLCVFSCSDVVVQIVDGRNPLLFRCADLVSTFGIVVKVEKRRCIHCLRI